jgi:predicted DNA-binding transcriptional regulator AlpA
MVAAINPQDKQALESAMLNVTSVATLLGCSSRTVYRLADGAEIPRPIKLGGRVVWPRIAFEKWLAGINAAAELNGRKVRRHAA